MEEDKLRGLEAVYKVRETSERGIVIRDILYLFLLQKLSIFLAPFYFSPLHGLVTHKSRNLAKSNAKAGIVCHDNKKDLGLPNSFLFNQGPNEENSKVEGIRGCKKRRIIWI